MTQKELEAAREYEYCAFDEIWHDNGVADFSERFQDEEGRRMFAVWQSGLLERVKDMRDYVIALENAIMSTGLKLPGRNAENAQES